MNLCSLVLDRYMAVVKPLKYVNFMTTRRITKLIFFSWVIPFCLAIFSVFMSLYLTFSLCRIVLSVCYAFLEIFFSCMLIFCFISMATVVYKQTRSSAILAKQLRFNHQGLTFNTYDKSAVVMLAVVVVFALACFATYLRCSFLQLSGNRRHPHLSCKSDFKFRIPMLVLNSAINPLAYAFFKRDIKKALKGKKHINLNAQLKLCIEYRMETWFWILGWILSILTIAGNGFTVLFVGSRRRLRTKTNALIVSLAVADFCVGAFVVPSLFVCDIRGGCIWPQPYASWVDFIRWLFEYASTMNMAVVKPLKYVNFMTTRRVTQLTFFSWLNRSWFYDFFCYNGFKSNVSFTSHIMVLSVCSTVLEIYFSCMLIYCFISMVTVVYRQTRSSAILAKQLRFNHRGLTFQKYDKSAVVMLAAVVGFALVCSAIYMRCDFL
ncbi:unnamed protein product, partial [Porites lobata]